MSIDVSKVVHICPICDDEFGSHNKVRKHITNREDEQHRGINGFNMDMTIVTEEKDVWDVESEQALHNKIATASEYFDDISNEEIREIADKAEVPVTRVMRVFKDEDIEYDVSNMNTKTHLGDITRMQRAVLEEWNGKNDSRSYRSIGTEANRKNEGLNMSLGYPGHVIKTYGWMKLPIYDGSEFKQKHTNGGDITVENTTDDMLDTTSAYLNPDDESDSADEQDNGSDPDTITKEDVYEAFLDSDVEFTVVPDEDEFDVMSKLIKSDHDDIARHLFE